MSAPPLINGKEVFDLLHEDLAALEGEFGEDTVSGVQAITEIGEYLRNGGGKRIRPALLFLAAKLVHYQGCGAVRLGAVVEIIHTATLVHDDIIDEAKTRRGRPAAASGLRREGRSAQQVGRTPQDVADTSGLRRSGLPRWSGGLRSRRHCQRRTHRRRDLLLGILPEFKLERSTPVIKWWDLCTESRA